VSRHWRTSLNSGDLAVVPAITWKTDHALFVAITQKVWRALLKEVDSSLTYTT